MTAPTDNFEDEALQKLEIRVDDVWQKIESAGGSRQSVTMVAVTKTFPDEIVALGVRAGLSEMGENRAQDLVARNDALMQDFEISPADLPRWHFIGGLQRNKVKLLAGRVALWHSIDRASLVEEVSKRDPGAEILIQVNTTGEAQKSGCEPTDAVSLVDSARQLGLQVSGLMTIGPTGGGDPKPSFDQLRVLREQCEVEHLSMGMSGDFELAVSCGATIIRLGSALFGHRKPPTEAG